MTTFDVTWLNKIADALIRNAGMDEAQRADFLTYHQYRHSPNPCVKGEQTEFRFCGRLGTGGKLYLAITGWRVNCYEEDCTPERSLAIARTNTVLKRLYEEALEEAERASSDSTNPE